MPKNPGKTYTFRTSVDNSLEKNQHSGKISGSLNFYVN